jgi:peroxiredoxin
VPATFVVSADGIVRARHVDPDYTRRMTPEAIIEALHRHHQATNSPAAQRGDP